MRHALCWRWLLLSTACLLLAGAPLRAQDLVAAVTGQADSDKATAAPIAARDIPARADADQQFAQDLQRRASQSAVDNLEKPLDDLTAGVTALGARMRSEPLEQLPGLRLVSLRRNWQFFDRQLGRWRRELQRELDRSTEDAAQLASRRVEWQATRDAAQQSALPPALVDVIDDVLKRIERADRALSVPLGRQLGLARRANTVKASIDAGLRAVASASESYDRRLWASDAPPLWNAWRERRLPGADRPGETKSLAFDRTFLRQYFAASSEQFWVHAIFALLVLPVLVWLRKRTQVLIAHDPELRSSTQALLRPLSSWLVLVLIGTLVFQSDAPIVLHEAALLMAVIPVLRLLPQEVFQTLGGWPYAATALYVLQRLGFLFVADALAYRVHLLVVTLLSLAALLWILLEARRRVPSASATKLKKAARAAGWLGVFLLAVSVTANLLGNLSLAEVLTRGTLDSGYLGLVLFASATVLGAIARLVIARRQSERFSTLNRHAGVLFTSLWRFVKYAAIAAWVLVTLNGFRALRPVVEWTRSVLAYEFGYGAITLTLGNILVFALSVYVSFWIARTLRSVLQDEVLGRMSLPRGVASSVSSLTYYAVLLLGLLIALAAAGFEVSQLALVVGALGVGIGFGLQNVVNNFVSGLILMFERPIQPGDVVEITGTTGTVREIGMRATMLTTGDGADAIIPNGTLLSEKLINWTLTSSHRRLDVDVGVAYGSDPRKVIALLEEVTRTTERVATDPPPAVLLTGFGPSSLNFGIRAWTKDFFGWVTVRTDLAVRVHDALKQAKIGIPFPQQDVYVRSLPPGPTVDGPAPESA